MKETKQILLCVIISLAFLYLSAISVCSAYAAAANEPPAIPETGDIWDGSIEKPETLVEKDGVYYYEITKCSQLAYVAETGGEWCTYNYILANNLILNDVIITCDEEGNCTNSEGLLEWTPIPEFSGIFLGNGHTISGVYIQSNSDDVGLFATDDGDIKNLLVLNSYISGNSGVGGIVGVGIGSVYRCLFNGLVKGNNNIGGIVGGGRIYISNSINYGTVLGKCYKDGISEVGGIVGFGAETNGCKNYGNVYAGGDYVGGVVGKIIWDHSVIKCENFGSVEGQDYVGGIVGGDINQDIKITESYNLGTIKGNHNVGGIFGATDQRNHLRVNDYIFSNVYNGGKVSGINNVGGITGRSIYATIQNCYNTGEISSDANSGAIIGNSDHYWGDRSKIENCYYLKEAADTNNTKAFGNLTIDTDGAAEAVSSNNMKIKSTFTNWDFDKVWRIDPDKNNGYPYLAWQSVEKVPVSGISLNKNTLLLSVGDTEYLSAAIYPANADNDGLVWESSDERIVTVNKLGKVYAVAPGNAEISVRTEDRAVTAACNVTVSERIKNEYRINSVTLTDLNGDVTEKPKADFWANVSITHIEAAGNAMIMLVSYDSGGKYIDMFCAKAKDIPIGATVELSFLMNNEKNKIAELKAFIVPSFTELTPIGEAINRRI